MDAKGENRTAVLKKEAHVRGLLRAAFLALFISACLGAILLLGAAALLSALPTATDRTEAVGCALGAATAFVGGILAGRLHKHASALSGVVFGLLYLVLMLTVSRFAGAGSSVLQRLFGYGLFLLLSLLGGALGGMRHSGKHRRRHRR